MFKQTALISIDSYKLAHADMYPVGTSKVYSNFTPRSLSHLSIPREYTDGKIVWFGLTAFLMELQEVWDESFFSLNKEEAIDDFMELIAPFAGEAGFDRTRLEQLWECRKLPLRIKALPEGSLVNINVPVLTITNTVDHAYWLPNYLETWLSSELWKSSTSATIARAYRKLLNRFVVETGSSQDFANWQLHDFSVRGMSGIHDAAKSGAGHLLFSFGTDNIPAVKLIRDCYQGRNTFIGASVPASEHAVMCAGTKESEIETFRRFITELHPSGIVSIVSDTWDFWKVMTEYTVELKDQILNRKPDALGMAKVVFRPDSGDPVKIICGYEMIGVYDTPEEFYADWDYRVSDLVRGDYAVKIGDKYYVAGDHDPGRASYGPQLSQAEVKGAVECLWDVFGGTTNDKGFKTLNQRVGLIYGDSITPQRALQILIRLKNKGFAADNIVFGIGSFTYQYNTRDTLGFAMKATYVVVNGEGYAIFKEPKTDSGTKKSAKGLLCVGRDGDDYVLFNDVDSEAEKDGELRVVFEDGEIINPEDFATIRARAMSTI